LISLPEFDPVSTGADWYDVIELTDADSGDPLDLTGFTTWTLEARLLTPNGVGEAVVTATYGAGLSAPDGLDGGILEILKRVPFANQESGRYRVTIVTTNGTDTLQLVSHIQVLNLTESPA
jgi:hypothetical protein